MAKKLLRPIAGRKIAGVCSGLGEYFNVSPRIFRVIFLLLCAPGGVPGPILYLLAYIFIPAQPLSEHPSFRRIYDQQPNTLGDDYKETIDV